MYPGDLLLILVVLTNLKLLGLSRLGSSIRTVAMQGVLLGLLPVVESWQSPLPRLAALAIGSMVLKGIVFPRLLFRALRETDVSREIEPLVGYSLSLLLGALGLGLSLWLGRRLPLPGAGFSLGVPVALFSILVGLFLLISRKGAVNQVLGFLVLENGIFTFGVGVMEETSAIIELGVLLDVFVAVFVMGIIIFHIRREFDHIDTDQLTALKD